MASRPALGRPAGYGDFVLARRMQLIDEMGHFHGDRLLDVGCGTGAQTLHMLDRFQHVVALDVVAAHLTLLQSHLRAQGSTNCDTVVYGGLAMPFRDASFDAVVSIETLEHVEDEARTLREIHRVLRPGGTLILSVPNRWWVFETHGADLPLLPWNRVPFFSWLPKPLHDRYARARIYTRRAIVALIQEHGFAICCSRYLTAPMDVVRSAALAALLRRTLFRGASTRVPFLSTSVFVMAIRT